MKVFDDNTGEQELTGLESTTTERTEVAREVPPEVTKWLESSEDLIFELEMDLAGKKYNPETGRYEDTGAGEIINAVGRRELISFLKTLLSKNVYMSNFTEKDINTRAKIIDMAINDYLFLNCERINLKEELYDLVLEKISTMIYAALRRAYQANEKKAITGFLSERVVTQTPAEPRKKRFGLF